MNTQQAQHLLAVIYDSVTNSVFESQVFVPLVRMLDRGEITHVTLVTFEADVTIKHRLGALHHPAITIIVLKRYPLVGTWSLRLASWQLIISLDLASIDAIRARGSLAGLIAKHVISLWKQWYRSQTIPLTIQARGLCAEEYRFTSEQKVLSRAQKIVIAWRIKLYDIIERKSYRAATGVTIEVVSNTLGKHLQKQYITPATMITLAQHDLVEIVPPDLIARQRADIRALLTIPTDAYVFCYSGSCKPWQCAEETVLFFASEARKNAKAFFLILSQDIIAFQQLLNKYQIQPERIRLLTVKPAQLLTYLCAADAGMLLRKADVVNWVSRPTKLLEYQAVRLKIIHNNTVGQLANKKI